MQEGRSSQYHRQLACVVGVIEPARMSGVPGMKPARETNHPISSLPPHPEKKGKKMNTGLLCPILSVNANSNADMHCHACTPVTVLFLVSADGYLNLNPLTHLKANWISSCLKWTSSSSERTASVWMFENGRKRLLRLFLPALTTYGMQQIS